MREKEQSTQRCAQLGSGARLKDNVHTIDSEAGSTVALLLHPFRPLVTSVDGGGTVRVHNYRHSTVINRSMSQVWSRCWSAACSASSDAAYCHELLPCHRHGHVTILPYA